MSEQHLEDIISRLRQYRVDINIGRPQVAYREKITRTGDG
jgi:translation elongation factor EF-G